MSFDLTNLFSNKNSTKEQSNTRENIEVKTVLTSAEREKIAIVSSIFKQEVLDIEKIDFILLVYEYILYRDKHEAKIKQNYNAQLVNLQKENEELKKEISAIKSKQNLNRTGRKKKHISYQKYMLFKEHYKLSNKEIAKKMNVSERKLYQFLHDRKVCKN